MRLIVRFGFGILILLQVASVALTSCADKRAIDPCCVFTHLGKQTDISDGYGALQVEGSTSSYYYVFDQNGDQAGYASLNKVLALTPGRYRVTVNNFLASGGDIFKLSKILGHSSIAITQQVYAHLHPDAFAEDYSRVAFAMPETPGAVLRLQR